jgi:phosphoribosylformimino-5-aminoimidazole carboxamide ribotide isomerase
MSEFTVFPAIDLRQGVVVRLKQGDPHRQTIYDREPVTAARRWLEAGAGWLHVVNLDGAFGEKDSDNRRALEGILHVCSEYQARVQFGGGLRSVDAIHKTLELGVCRVVLGTLAVEQPQVFQAVVLEYGADRVAAGIDARDGLVRTRGWAEATLVSAVELASHLSGFGLRWLIYTDVARDGIGSGLNLPATLEIASLTGLKVIASGGVEGPADIRRAQAAGLAGVITGRALYEGRLVFGQW